MTLCCSKFMRKAFVITLLLGMTLILSSCQPRDKHPRTLWADQPGAVPTPSGELSNEEILAGVKNIAVVAFRNDTYGDDNTLSTTDLRDFAEHFANHLVGADTFDSVMYPKQAEAALAGTDLRLHNQDDLREVGNTLEVDAVIFGVIKEYTMYYPPRMSISMKFYVTKLQRFATSREVSFMAHAGVPLAEYDPTFFRQLWDKSAFYSAESSLTRKKLEMYHKYHDTEFYGFKDDRTLRTKNDFFNFIAFDLSRSLVSERTESQRTNKATNYRGGFKKGRAGRPAPKDYYNR